MRPECRQCRGAEMHRVYRPPSWMNRGPFDSTGDLERRVDDGVNGGMGAGLGDAVD